MSGETGADRLAKGQRQGVTLILAFSGVIAVGSVLASLAVGGPVLIILAAAGLGLGIGLAGQLLAPALARLCAGLGLMAEVMVMTASFAGQPWQPDTKGLYFAALVALVLLSDSRAILAAAGMVVLQHLVLTLTVPALIYPGTDLLSNLVRTLLQATLLTMETVVLVGVVEGRFRLDAAQRAGLARAAALNLEAETARQMAESKVLDARRAEQAAASLARDLEQSLAAANRLSDLRQQDQTAARDLAEREMQRAAETAAAQAQVLAALRTALSVLGQGDFTQEIQQAFASEYEDLRKDFNGVLADLSHSVAIALAHTSTIDQDTTSISSAAKDLAERSEKQAATMEATAAAMEQLAASVASAAHRATAARTKSEAARDSAESGGQVVAQATLTMQSIASSSEKISRITTVIDDIAFQTNLLALNAGVEAARVGDAGRGFAVVASEVRALAQRSSDAAREINELIAESGALVRKGVTNVEQTGQALQLILEQVKQIATDVAEIACSSDEQAKGIGAVNGSMQGLGQLTQQISAMFEETTAATISLERETRDLRCVLGQFRIRDQAAAGPQRHSRAA